MKVCIVSETFLPDINGVSLTLGHLAQGLEKAGHSVSIIRPTPARKEFPALPNETRLPSFPIPGYAGLRVGWFSFARLAWMWRHDRPDVIYSATEGPLGVAAVHTARWMHIPVVSGYHTHFGSYLPQYGFGGFVNFAEKFQKSLHNKTAFTLTPSRNSANILHERGYRRVEILRRGVDADLFNPARRDEALRASWGAGPETIVALLAGRVAGEKNLPLALEAAADFRATNPNFRVVVVGDGPILKEMESRFPFAIFANELRGEDLGRHYASSDLLLFPSLTETFGNVLLEAMASGIASLSFDYAAAHEHIVNGENGFVVPYGDENAFRRQLQEILRLPIATLRAMGAEARLSAQVLSWESIVCRFAELLSSATLAKGAQSSRSPRLTNPVTTIRP